MQNEFIERNDLIERLVSIEALIDEIKSLQRYDYYVLIDGDLCCEPDENGDNFNADEVLTVLNKYRGEK